MFSNRLRRRADDSPTHLSTIQLRLGSIGNISHSEPSLVRKLRQAYGDVKTLTRSKASISVTSGSVLTSLSNIPRIS